LAGVVPDARMRGVARLGSDTLARTVEMDRESIERSDFPLVRRGYDPAAVSAHLRAVATMAQELSQRAASLAREPSLGSTAATQVQGILEAAQTTAAEIEREAQQDAQSTRDEAAGELERARAHVQTLARAAAALLAQVQTLDGEVSALAQSLRAEEVLHGGTPRSAPAPGEERETSSPTPAVDERSEPVSPGAVVAADEEREAMPSAPISATAATDAQELIPPTPALPGERGQDLASPVSSAVPATGVGEQGREDLDGARLVALNMALSGEPREQTDRYLADSFQLSDRAKLLDEVYAAIEG
jgi:hypothetical protein